MVVGNFLILKILLCLTLFGSLLFFTAEGAKDGRGESENNILDFDVPQGDDPSVLVSDTEQEKKAVSRLRSPQLIPGSRSDRKKEGRKQRKGNKKERKYQKHHCPSGEFWHHRGKRCVPEKCPEGSYGRNSNTGECAIAYGHTEDNPEMMGFSKKSRRIPPKFGFAIGDRNRRPMYWP